MIHGSIYLDLVTGTHGVAMDGWYQDVACTQSCDGSLRTQTITKNQDSKAVLRFERIFPIFITIVRKIMLKKYNMISYENKINRGSKKS